MKNLGQLITLPSIPTTSNAFAPLTLQHPSTYFPTEFVLQIILHTINYICPKKMILSASQLHHSNPNIIQFPNQNALMFTSQKFEI